VTLRSRLMLVLIGVVAVALAVSGVIVYTSIRSFLLSRLDPQLQGASFSVSRVLLVENSLVPRYPPPGGLAAGQVPTHLFPRNAALFPSVSTPAFGSSPSRARSGPEFTPTGTVGELVRPDGHVQGRIVRFDYGGRPPVPPAFPDPLPRSTASHPAIFSATSSAGVGYRVIARPIGFEHLTVVVAVPMTDVEQTLHQLLLVEILVGLGALLGLGVLAWTVMRRGLRPLEDMAPFLDRDEYHRNLLIDEV